MKFLKFCPFLLLLACAIAIRPLRPFAPLDPEKAHHSHNVSSHIPFFSSSNFTSLIQIHEEFTAPKTAAFMVAVQKACGKTEDTTAVQYWDCLHKLSATKKLPKPLDEFQSKLFVDVPLDFEPKLVVVEGMGPVGGFAAIQARFLGHKVIVYESKTKFTDENQAFAVFEFTVQTLLKLDLDFSHFGFCKSVLQYVYLFIFALFAGDETFFYPTEIVGFNVAKKQVISLEWESVLTRAERKKLMVDDKIYHQPLAAWTKIVGTKDWDTSLAVVVKSLAKVHISDPIDFILSAGGANSIFHYLLGIDGAWNDPSKHTTTVGLIVKFPFVTDATTQKDYETIAAKVEAWASVVGKGRGALHQPKFVPINAYDPNRKSELWVESFISVGVLTKGWSNFALMLTGDKNTKIADFTSRKTFKTLNENVNFKTLEAETPLATFLDTQMVNLGDLTKLEESGIEVDYQHAKLTSFYVSNRIIPKASLISLIAPTVPCVFLGDSFHESFFVTGKGLNTHILEMMSTDGKGALFSQLLLYSGGDQKKEVTKWAADAWALGSKYVETSGAQFDM